MTMKTKNFRSVFFSVLLTFTSLGVTTSTAFSQNLNDLRVGEMKNVVIHEIPKPLADFSFKDAEGKNHQISDFKGKVVLVNFWATWCGPCREEMPSIDRLQGEMASDNFTVLAISQDLQGIERVQKFLKSLDIENLAALNDKTVKSGRAAGVFGLPATLLLNRNGLEIARLVGPAEWDTDEAKRLIQTVIDRK
ncbi:MAG: TlpA disulfide reductase family protein [Pseudomonas marincola]